MAKLRHIASNLIFKSVFFFFCYLEIVLCWIIIAFLIQFWFGVSYSCVLTFDMHFFRFDNEKIIHISVSNIDTCLYLITSFSHCYWYQFSHTYLLFLIYGSMKNKVSDSCLPKIHTRVQELVLSVLKWLSYLIMLHVWNKCIIEW